MKAMKTLPPPPREPPPQPPKCEIIEAARGYSKAKRAYEAALANARQKCRAVGSFVLMSNQNRFVLVDVETSHEEHVWDLLMSVPGTDYVIAKSDAYDPGDEAYLETQGGESIVFRIGDFSLDGWVAARFPQASEWKWFPLALCRAA